MADFTASPMAGSYAHSDEDAAGSGIANQLTTLTNVAGALLSLALIVGIGIWGYKLLMRDVSGIPVVQAAEGEMRIRPEEPGGELARHQGLSVNAVAAEGMAAKPADRLILAPKPIDLTEEDQVMEAAMVAETPQSVEVPALPEAETLLVDPDEVSAALESGNVDALVAKLTEGVTPLSEIEETPEEVVAAITETVVAEVTAAEKQIAALRDAPGVRASMRPQLRPAELRAAVTQAVAEAIPAGPVDVDPASLPAGTRLAQLGAFDSPEVARAQWDQIATRFDSYLNGKSRIVQKATSGGRVFYRLRALGFEDIADARRFCSALVAQNADCIPVVTR